MEYALPPSSAITLQGKMQGPGGFTTGFDYLRILLSVGVLVFHSVALSRGSDAAVWTGPFRFFPATILPMFFALSGFLVTGSLQRVRLHQFITLRLTRLIPALAVEITLSAVLIGSLVTTLPLLDYLSAKEFYKYFLNIVGLIHYFLPGVFEDNRYPRVMNAQLWTIPFELECYLGLILLAILGVVKRPKLFAIAVLLICIAFTAAIFTIDVDVNPTNHVPGRMLVVSFLAAVALYLNKDKILFSNILGAASLISSAALVQYPSLCYLAPFPIAYATVWLGLMRPPPVPFGDLSYGVFLFHFPVEQIIMHLAPKIQDWWLLTLIALPLTTVCAWLSWTLVESPMLSRKKMILSQSDRWMAAINAVSQRTLGIGGPVSDPANSVETLQPKPRS